MGNNLHLKRNNSRNFFTVAPGIWGMKDIFVNIYMIMNPFDGNWVLVDAGLFTSYSKIKKMAARLFGDNSQPSAIILTHGHFDHVGSLQKLAEEWNVPVYSHYLEIPYLTGKSSYPPGDPTVGGGLMSLMSWAYPKHPINIWNHINILPENETVPGLPEWKYFHTPGHSPGHISLFREGDGVLIAGDALVTTKAESAFSVMLQIKKISGPPKYFTPDWVSARQSVKTLMKLEPKTVASGHGKPMYGKEVRKSLHKLSEDFYHLAVPVQGRYILEPAVSDASGVIYIPPSNFNKKRMVIKLLSFVAVSAAAYVLLKQKSKNKRRQEILSYEIW
ncbi:MAG: MBL fold metallo-hydrolase [Chitinophagaceae bacterium]|nr:MBL fold metallo-hydrolase [Chitinophagaceae bacterium]